MEGAAKPQSSQSSQFAARHVQWQNALDKTVRSRAKIANGAYDVQMRERNMLFVLLLHHKIYYHNL